MITVSIYIRSDRNTNDAVLDECSGLTITNKTCSKLILMSIIAPISCIMNRANHSQVFYRCTIGTSK